MKTLLALFIALAALSSNALALEMAGLLGYDFNLMSGKPTNTVRTGGGVSYVFLIRTEVANNGKLESGFLYTPTSITTSYATVDVKSTGSFWILPLLYRFDLGSPFFSLGLGADYATFGSSQLSANPGGIISSSYQSHFGLEASFEANQDVGEDLSAVLDLRYRQGLGDAITFSSQGTKFNFLMIALGVQKRLE